MSEYIYIYFCSPLLESNSKLIEKLSVKYDYIDLPDNPTILLLYVYP